MAKRMAAAAVLLIGLAQLWADESADRVKLQKEAAEANWKKLFEDEAPAHYETEHLLLYAPAAWSEKQLKALGTALEAQYTLASKALKIEPKTELWPGKLAVYLLEDRPQFQSLVRTVAKKRPDPDELGVFSARGDTPFVGAGPPQEKHDPSLEAQAGEQLAAAMLTQKAGADVPEWVRAGFGRATVWRATPNSRATRQQRDYVRRLVAAGRTAKDVWSGRLKAAEAPLLRGSLVYFLAYDRGAEQFPAFLEGFKPEQGRRNKTAEEALKAARLSPEVVEASWRAWTLRGR